MRFQIGRHDYVVEEYQGSLLASRALAGGEFSVEHRDGEISLVGIERNVSRWQATTIAIPYLIVSVFTSIWAVKYLWKHRRTAAK